MVISRGVKANGRTRSSTFVDKLTVHRFPSTWRLGESGDNITTSCSVSFLTRTTIASFCAVTTCSDTTCGRSEHATNGKTMMNVTIRIMACRYPSVLGDPVVTRDLGADRFQLSQRFVRKASLCT